MAKHGVVGLTKVAGIEYAAKGIRVNAIAPCLVETPITKGWMIQSSVRQLLVIFQWIGPAKPEEITEMVVFISSPGATFRAGHTFVVDGG